jgi:hypothetical protein
MRALEDFYRTQLAPEFIENVAIQAKPQAVNVSDIEGVERTSIGETADPRSLSSLALVEMLLKDRWRLYRLLRVPAASAVMLPRLLGIALAGYTLFGVTMAVVMAAAGTWPVLGSIASWIDSPAALPFTFAPIEGPLTKTIPLIGGKSVALIIAYAFGLVAASCVCLPSLYFYCLLAGVRMTMIEVVLHAVKSKAVAAVALVGILPIYVALAMGVAIFDAGEPLVRAAMLLGLALPFIAGIWGTVAMYQAFALVCDTLPANRIERRSCFLRRLVLSWSVIYTAVMPVMIYSVWEVLSRLG